MRKKLDRWEGTDRWQEKTLNSTLDGKCGRGLGNTQVLMLRRELLSKSAEI